MTAEYDWSRFVTKSMKEKKSHRFAYGPAGL